LLLFSFFSCNDSTNTFPYVRIDLTISIDTQLGNMNVGEHRFIDNAGYGGLVIYRKSLNEYQAFDRACTHDYVDSCILKDYKDFDGILVCPCCNSKFLLSQSGSVFKAPATIPLEEYNTYLQGNFLRVSN
jgi:Rieske Fe-S protein